jgi:transcriptional regulator with XRE-family HTH domain
VKKTNFDLYLEEQLKDPDFAERFRDADAAWDIALQLADLREQAQLTQRELAGLVGTTQQQISRMESPDYQGHSLRMLRKIAGALNSQLVVSFAPALRKTRRKIVRATRTRELQRRARSTGPEV